MTLYLQLAVLAACVATALTLPQQYNSAYTTPVPILSQHFDGPYPDGKFYWEFEAGNGIKEEERNSPKNLGPENENSNNYQGFYQYYDPEGKLHRIDYISDENGFQPQGADIPTPPPVPVEILKSLQQQSQKY